jgi:hypothetical protein
MAPDELESEEIHHMYQMALAGAAYEMDQTTGILQLSPVMFHNNATGCFDWIIVLSAMTAAL